MVLSLSFVVWVSRVAFCFFAFWVLCSDFLFGLLGFEYWVCGLNSGFGFWVGYIVVGSGLCV